MYLLKTYDREENKFLKEVLGIVPIEVPKVSYGYKDVSSVSGEDYWHRT